MSDEWGKVMRLEAEGWDGSIPMINYIYSWKTCFLMVRRYSHM